jgi:hypothetical protein
MNIKRLLICVLITLFVGVLFLFIPALNLTVAKPISLYDELIIYHDYWDVFLRLFFKMGFLFLALFFLIGVRDPENNADSVTDQAAKTDEE